MKKTALFLALAFVLAVSSFAMESPAHPVIYNKEDYEIKVNETDAAAKDLIDGYLTENIDVDSMAGWYFTMNNCLLVYSTEEEAARKVVESCPYENPFNVLYFDSEYSYGELMPVIEKIDSLRDEILKPKNNANRGLPEDPYMLTYVTQYGIEIQLNGNCDNSDIIDWYRTYEHRDMITLKLKYPMWNPA